MGRRTFDVRGVPHTGAVGLACVGLLGALVVEGCPKKDDGSPEPTVARARVVTERPLSAPDVRAEPAGDPGPLVSPQTIRAPADAAILPRAVAVADLIELLRNKEGLRALVPREDAAAPSAGPAGFGPFGRLVSAFAETVRDDDAWQFEGTNGDGLVRAVTLTFAPTPAGGWRFHSAAIRILSDDPPRAFSEVRRHATAILGKAKWMDLGGTGRTAWSLGERWELTLAVLQGGQIQLRSGLPARN